MNIFSPVDEELVDRGAAAFLATYFAGVAKNAVLCDNLTGVARNALVAGEKHSKRAAVTPIIRVANLLMFILRYVLEWGASLSFCLRRRSAKQQPS